MPEPKYKIKFASKITKVAGAEVEKYISLAGLEKLKPLMPAGINLERNGDVIAIALNAAVGNYSNKNSDAITNEAMVNIAPDFVWKYVNLGHDREKIVGAICNYGFSNFVTNELITAEEAKSSTDPVNLSLVCLLWRGCLSESANKLIEAAGDPTNIRHGDISASWEMYYDDYEIAVGPSKNISECQIYAGADKAQWEKYIPSETNMASGMKDDQYVFRVFKQDGLLGAGIGLVTQPAAEVSGFIKISEAETIPEQKETASVKPSVTNQYMSKYQFLNKISEAGVKESIASELDTYISNELEKAGADYKTKISQYETDKASILTQLDAANQTAAKSDASIKQLQADIEKANAQIETLQKSIAAKQKEENYNLRMSFFDEAYELSAEHRKILASRLGSIETDEQFESLKSEMAVLLASIDKAKAKLAVASVTSDNKSIDSALKNADSTVTLPNSSVNPNKTTYLEQVNDIFGKDSVKIVVK